MFCTPSSLRPFSNHLPANISHLPALNTTATLHHSTRLPPSTSFTHALSLLHNHPLLIRLDPEYASHTPLPSNPATPDTKRYKVTDHMNALPAGLWDTTVTFEAEMTNTEDGVLWIIRAPLGLVQTTTWRCLKTGSLGAEEREGEGGGEEGKEDKGEWSLVEDVEIKANRMLVGTVRGKCEENWRGAHAKFVAHLKDPPSTAHVHA
ncbi:hypothetical protein EJ02DRAFT_460259 [Clathrospora elynae]|uniref:DUF7053 domain-containing protein n=1 Tax=Clathrospora elynae TaxID=706981 RepID=A0A6A5SAX7_9PLEO|nr:hypothetical protein EJ02DRAFT_460259 [Clathrospora elynae]